MIDFRDLIFLFYDFCFYYFFRITKKSSIVCSQSLNENFYMYEGVFVTQSVFG